METWDAIRSRRDVRAFTDRPIDDFDLDRILEAGRRAPSSRNWQPWDFVVVTDRKQLAELATVWQGAGHVASSAATVAIVAPVVEEARRQTEYFDLGQAVISMMLAAADVGIGSGHSAVGDQDLARRVLGLPEDRICAHLVPFGYPAGRPLVPLIRPDRRPFDEVVHRGRW
ncbi:MAG TPA: nitroreductase family protein [Gaiellaceae bacterium]|nr:nitroreductase family protein [Gaiellaceae bacterium]